MTYSNYWRYEMEISTSELSTKEAYGLLTSLIVPRPIAFISTRDASGHCNVAPFSFFMGVGSDPPMLAISIAEGRDKSRKDTYRIIKETGVFCVNLVEEHIAESMHLAGESFEPHVSEFDEVGLVAVPCKSISCVRVKEARASLECRLADERVYGNDLKCHLIVGEVVQAYLDDEILLEGANSADAEKLQPIARMGQSYYATLGERFELGTMD